MNELKYIENLVNRYFAAETSIVEERELRQLLATTKVSSPLIDEARAVMGYVAMSPDSARARNTRHRFHWISAAASVGILLITGGLLFASRKVQTETHYIAYVNSVAITDPESVRMMALETLSKALGADTEMSQTPIKELNSTALIENDINNQIFPI